MQIRVMLRMAMRSLTCAHQFREKREIGSIDREMQREQWLTIHPSLPLRGTAERDCLQLPNIVPEARHNFSKSQVLQILFLLKTFEKGFFRKAAYDLWESLLPRLQSFLDYTTTSSSVKSAEIKTRQKIITWIRRNKQIDKMSTYLNRKQQNQQNCVGPRDEIWLGVAMIGLQLIRSKELVRTIIITRRRKHGERREECANNLLP